MERLMDLLGMTLGGWLGWAAGRPVSIFTAFVLGVVGTGVGLWFTRRATRALLP